MDTNANITKNATKAETTRSSQDNPAKFQIRLEPSIRLTLVDLEQPGKTFGCVICGPAFIAKAGDCPSALILGLDLDPKIMPKLSIILVSADEVTLGIKGRDLAAIGDVDPEFFEREGRIVFMERLVNDPKVTPLEGLSLLLLEDELWSTEEADQLQPQHHLQKPRMNPRGSQISQSPSITFLGHMASHFRENSKSNLQFSGNQTSAHKQQQQSRRSTIGNGVMGATASELIQEANSSESKAYKFKYVYIRNDQHRLYWYESRSRYLADPNDVIGYINLHDIVAIRQSSKHFKFDNSPNISSVEFVLKIGHSVTIALGFPFPLVQWLYAIHATLRLPRMVVTLSPQNDGLESSWTLTLLTPHGAGFSISHPLITEHFSYICRFSRLGFSITSGSGGTIIDRISFSDNAADDDGPGKIEHTELNGKSNGDSHSPSILSPVSRSMTNRIRDLFVGGSLTLQPNSDTTPPGSPITASSITRAKGFSFSLRTRQHSSSSSGNRPSIDATPSLKVKPSKLKNGGSRRDTDQSLTSNIRQKSVTFGENVTIVSDALPLTDDYTGPTLRESDLMLKIDTHWVLDSTWRETLALLTAKTDRPLVLTFARVATLSELCTNPQLLQKCKEAQRSIWLNNEGVNVVTQNRHVLSSIDVNDTIKGQGEKVSIGSSFDITDAQKDGRRRAATRQLLKRQTFRMFSQNPQVISNHSNERKVTSSDARSVRVASSSVSATTGLTTTEQSRPAASSSAITSSESSLALTRASKNAMGVWSLPSALVKAKQSATRKPIVKPKGFLTSATANSTSPATALTKILSQLSTSKPMAAKEDALGFLLSLTSDKMNHSLCGPQCVPILISLMDPSARSSPLCLERCAACLWNLSDDRANALLIAGCGGVQALTRLLTSEDAGLEYCREEACGCLWSLMDDETNVSLVILSGAVNPLLELLTNKASSEFLIENILGCLWQLTTVAGGRKLVLEGPGMLTLILKWILGKVPTNICKENLYGILSNLLIDSATKERIILETNLSAETNPSDFKENSAKQTLDTSASLHFEASEVSISITEEPSTMVKPLQGIQSANPLALKVAVSEVDASASDSTEGREIREWTATANDASLFQLKSGERLSISREKTADNRDCSPNNLRPAPLSQTTSDPYEKEETKQRDTRTSMNDSSHQRDWSIRTIDDEDLEPRRRRKADSNLLRKLVQSVMFGHSAIVKENATLCLIELSRSQPKIALKLCQDEAALTALLRLILLESTSEDLKIMAARAIHILAESDAKNRQQLSELGSVPEVLRLLEEAKMTREARHKKIAHARTVILQDSELSLEDLPSSATGKTKNKYAHFDSALLDSALGQVIAQARGLGEQKITSASTN